VTRLWGTDSRGKVIQVLGPFAIRFELVESDYDFPHLLAMPMSSIVPRSGLEAGVELAGEWQAPGRLLSNAGTCRQDR